MSLRNAKSRSQISIANKLTFSFTAASIIILSLIALVLSWALSNMMLLAEKQYLIDEAHVIQELLKNYPNDFSSLKQEVSGVPQALKNNATYTYYVNVIDKNEIIIMQTPDAKEHIANAPFPKNVTAWQSHFREWVNDKGQHYLLISAPAKYDHQGNIITNLQIALNTSYPNALIQKYRLYIAAFFVLLVGLFNILGKLIAKKSLKRLYELATITEQITVSKLSDRIDTTRWPPELTSLGHSFNKMIGGIEKAFDNLSQCTNEIAHELRIPINNLIGSTEIILSRERDPIEYKELLCSNLEEFRRLSRLTDNILFLARNEMPNAFLHFTKLELAKEVKTVCEFFKDFAAEKNIQIIYEGKGSVRGDLLLVQRAITNILNNAIKYTPEGGKIHLTVRSNHDFNDIIITDNGVGISQDKLPHIFDRFYKIDSKSTGWGLGLAIVKTIMELHKGSIDVESIPGEGSRFFLRFPAFQ